MLSDSAKVQKCKSHVNLLDGWVLSGVFQCAVKRLHDINFRTLTAIFCVCTLRVQSSHELSGWTLIDKLCHIHDKPSDH